MHLSLQTAVATDTSYEFGDGKWDLVLYSWVPPDKSAAKAVQSLRPGGVVVVEAGREWFPPNGLLKMFDALRIVQYEDRLAPSDFFRRREMPVVRLVAEKPVP
jgi:SAM-dependent methyltransferase